MSSIPTIHRDGDASIGRNVTVGGKATVRGSAVIGHSLRVEGWLDAPNIKGVNKGVFADVATLRAAYPSPERGWFAFVGDTLPAPLYVVNERGEWIATGKSAGQVMLDGEALQEALQKGLEEDIERRDRELQTRMLRCVYNYDYNAEPTAGHVHDSMAEKDTGAVAWLTEYKRFALCAPGGTEYYLQWPSMTSYMVERADGWHVRKNFYGNMSTRHVVYIDSDGDITDVHELLQKAIDSEAATRKAADDRHTEALATERGVRADAVRALTDKADAEQDARESGDRELAEAIDNERETRQRAESALLDVMNKEQESRMAADKSIRDGIAVLSDSVASEKRARESADAVVMYHYDYDDDLGDGMLGATPPGEQGAVVWLRDAKRFAFHYTGASDTPTVRYYGEWSGMEAYMVRRDDGWHVRPNFYGNMAAGSRRVVFIDGDGNVTDIHKILQEAIDSETLSRERGDTALRDAIDSKLHVVEFDGIIRYAMQSDTLNSATAPGESCRVAWVEAAGRFCIETPDGTMCNNAMPFDMLSPYHASQSAPAREAIYRDRSTGISYVAMTRGGRQELVPLSPVTGCRAVTFWGAAPEGVTTEGVGLGTPTDGIVVWSSSLKKFLLAVGTLNRHYYDVWGGTDDGAIAPSTEYNDPQTAICGRYFFSTSDRRLYRRDARGYGIEVIGGDDGVADEVTSILLYAAGRVWRCGSDGVWKAIDAQDGGEGDAEGIRELRASLAEVANELESVKAAVAEINRSSGFYVRGSGNGGEAEAMLSVTPQQTWIASDGISAADVQVTSNTEWTATVSEQ